MSELKPCPICGGRFQPFKDNYGKCGAYCTECGMYFGVELECGVELHDGWKAKFDSEEELMDAINRRAQPDNARPPCYLTEKDNPYPLCIGRGMTVCAHCCLWADYDQDENESRVKHPLTLEELRGMDGEPVWIEVFNDKSWWVVIRATAREKLTTDYGGWFTLDSYGKTWIAYRRKREGSDTP